jgi:hypothetical protein
MAVFGAQTIMLRDNTTGGQVNYAVADAEQGYQSALSADGKVLVTGGAGYTTVWKLDPFQRMYRLDLSSFPSASLSISSDSKTLAMADTSEVKLYDLRNGRSLGSIAPIVPGSPSDGATVAFSPAGDLAVAIRNNVQRIDPVTAQPLSRMLTCPGGNLLCLAFSGDGRLLAAGTDGGKVVVWDAKTGAQRHLVNIISGGGPFPLAVPLAMLAGWVLLWFAPSIRRRIRGRASRVSDTTNLENRCPTAGPPAVMATAERNHGGLRLTLGLLVVLAGEALLWLSERYQWVAWHKGYAVLIAVAGGGVFLPVLVAWFLRARGFRWQLQFSVVFLVPLVVAAALPIAWLATEVKAASRQRETADALLKAGWPVVYDCHIDAEAITREFPPPSAPLWLRNIFGNDLFGTVTSVGGYGGRLDDVLLKQVGALAHLQLLGLSGSSVTDRELRRIEGLTQLRSLGLELTAVSDAGLQHLEPLTQLRELDLNNTKVTDAGLKHLEKLPELRSLFLGDTQVGDAGLKHLEGLARLRWLFLDNTQVTDAGLEHLKGLRRLKELCLRGTKVSNAGVKRLQRALPNCEIVH